MCDSATVKETVQELLNYLEQSDNAIKEELTLKIAILSERFATDNQWCAHRAPTSAFPPNLHMAVAPSAG